MIFLYSWIVLFEDGMQQERYDFDTYELAIKNLADWLVFMSNLEPTNHILFANIRKVK